jgi:hypothetical protein
MRVPTVSSPRPDHLRGSVISMTAPSTFRSDDRSDEVHTKVGLEAGAVIRRRRTDSHWRPLAVAHGRQLQGELTIIAAIPLSNASSIAVSEAASKLTLPSPSPASLAPVSPLAVCVSFARYDPASCATATSPPRPPATWSATGTSAGATRGAVPRCSYASRGTRGDPSF